ncbi:MAG TPA: Tc toxin subunit A, partial [Pseudomonas sp.]|nr:Tc toxin subunit A [Pseudomonas sp.]
MPGTNTTSTQTSAPAITKAATYRGLFPEQLADRCSPDALESNSGPIAYLHALYQQALALEASSTSDQRLTLAQRRPDIGELLLNREGLEKSIPPLTLVINALTRQAQAHAGSSAHLPEVISQAQYPAGLPFHYPLAQIKAVLNYKKIPLFELLQTSKHTFPNFCYQHLRTEELRQVMRTATGFNPALQNLLLDNSATTTEGYLLAQFGVAGSNASALTQLRKVDFFCQKTGLKPEQVHDLLAISGVDDNARQGFTSVKRSSAYPSQDSTESDGHLYGAAFINNGKAPALSLEDTFAGAGLTLAIKGGTAAHFGRMNKVIHLQHALKLPFAEVDLLLMSALRAEGQTRNFRITQNTLRALGVYRYLNEVYAITAGQYAALIHEVSPFAVGEEVAFLDRVLDGPGAGQLAQIDDQLIIDDSEFDPAQPADSAAPSPIGRLCRALGTDESLTRIYVAQVTAALGLEKPVLSLTFMSSLYRLSRLPRLLRVPAHEGASLIAMLALSNTGFQNIVAGKGRISDDDTQPDILDALIALANTQRWLRRNRLSAPQVLAVLQPPDQLPQYLPELG